MSKELFHSRSSQNLPFPITERITTSELAETRKLAPFPTRILPCKLSSLKSGCYRLTYRPNRSLNAYRGTLRVNPEEEHIAVSGDLYRFTEFPFLLPENLERALKQKPLPYLSKWIMPDLKVKLDKPEIKFGIPIYPRNKYYSYWSVTNIVWERNNFVGKCQLRLYIDEYIYDSRSESFSDVPDHQYQAILQLKTAPKQYPDEHYYSGSLYEGRASKGRISIGWVSNLFRKATIEIDVVAGSEAPQPVTLEGETHSFKSIFATAGWDLKIINDQTEIEDTYTGGSGEWEWTALNSLMEDVRKSSADLDQEWYAHLLCVPKIKDAWGVMYDQNETPREGAATNSHAKFPNRFKYGTTKNKFFKDAPGGAYIRSASHEIGHIFNMYHSSLIDLGETGIDGTIMTGTVNIASEGSLGQFPGSIEFRFNEHDRHHMIHFPDPVVRPGGASFGAGHIDLVPEIADKSAFFFQKEVMELNISVNKKTIMLGEPLEISYEIENKADYAIPVPNNIGSDTLSAHIQVSNPEGRAKSVSPNMIQLEDNYLEDLEAGKKLKNKTILFWSSKGFVFEAPGQHQIVIRILWSYQGIPHALRGEANVWVDYPVTQKENSAASIIFDNELGKHIALKGSSPDSRIEKKISDLRKLTPKHPTLRYLKGSRGKNIA